MSIKIYHKQPIATHGYVREFSEELHGEEFENHAKAYIERYKDNVDHVEGLEEEPKTITYKEMVKELTEAGITVKIGMKRIEVEALYDELQKSKE